MESGLFRRICGNGVPGSQCLRTGGDGFGDCECGDNGVEDLVELGVRAGVLGEGRSRGGIEDGRFVTECGECGGGGGG